MCVVAMGKNLRRVEHYVYCGHGQQSEEGRALCVLWPWATI